MSHQTTRITIRIGHPEDAELLSELSRITFYDTFASQNAEGDMQLYLSKNFHPDQLAKELKEVNTTFFIVYADDRVAGYAKVGRKESPAALTGKSFLEVERLYVLKEYQGQKIGAELLNECIGHALANQIEVLWLGVWEHNDKAKAFYEHFGFVKFGEHPFVLGSDVQTDWVMKLDL